MICYEAFDYISLGSICKDFAMSHFRVNLPFEGNVAKTLQMGLLIVQALGILKMCIP